MLTLSVKTVSPPSTTRPLLVLPWDESEVLYTRELLGRGEDKSVCRRRGSCRGLHRPRMSVEGEMALGAISTAEGWVDVGYI